MDRPDQPAEAAPDPGTQPAERGPSADELLRQELAELELQRSQRPRAAAPQRRGWLLLLAALVGIATAAVYYLQSQREPDKMELLRFVSLYLTLPLSMSVLLLFAYFTYPKR